MQLIYEDELDNHLGKPSFWNPTQLVGKINYQQGISEFDAYRTNMWDATPLLINLKMRPNGLELSTLYKVKMRKYGLLFTDIKQIELETPAQVVTQKDKSVIGRALLGGVLLGPLGAIVGGLSGIGSTQKIESSDLFLSIVVNQGQNEEHIVGLVSPASRTEVENFLKKNLARFYR